MAVFKLSLEDVKSKPESFLYIFASDSFCSALGTKASNIIKQKRANQRKILIQSAQNAGLKLEDYTNAIRDGFIETYGIKPAEALVKLAQGEEVAGKNWAEGVYGVGALYNAQFSQDLNISVSPETGKILVGGTEASGQQAIVANNCPNNVQGYSYTDPSTCATYSSRYRKIKKAYYAHLYADKDGNKYLSNGTKASSADGSIWENTFTILEKLLNWIMSLFGGTNTSKELISSKNTAPSQGDGFVTQEAGIGTVGVVLLAALAAGTLLNKKGVKK